MRFVAAQPVAENSARTPLIYKEALRKKKVRTKQFGPEKNPFGVQEKSQNEITGNNCCIALS